MQVSMAQNDFYINAEGDLGSPINRVYASPRILSSTFFSSYQLQGAVSVSYRVFDRIGLELGFSQNKQQWGVKDIAFSGRNTGFDAILVNTYSYYDFYTGLHYVFPLSEANRIVAGGAFCINKMGAAKTLSDSKLFEKNNETVNVNTNYLTQNTCINGEVTYEHVIKNKNLISFGLKVNIGGDNILKGDYNVTKSGLALEADQFASNGTFIGLSIKYGFRFLHIPKRERIPKPVVPPDTSQPKHLAHHQHSNTEINTGGIPKEVAGRNIKVLKVVKVSNEKVTIKVWDSGIVDGDRVSLNFNGTWIIEDHELTKEPYVFTVDLHEGKNIFVLHALNLGRISPNTAACLIDEGTKQHLVDMKSTLKSSGTIEIDYKPVTPVISPVK
jgi:hypothetical protein